MKRYTEEEKQRAIKKLVRKYAHWNIIYSNDADIRAQLDHDLHRAVWSVIVKLDFRNEYFKLTRDIRHKPRTKKRSKGVEDGRIKKT